VNLGLDASVGVKWFVIENGHATAPRPFAVAAAWPAPSLLSVEVASMLWRRVRRGGFAPEAATEAAGRLAHVPIRYVAMADLGAVAFALATRLDHPVENGRHLAVAEAEDGRVVTADRRLPARVQGTSLSDRVVALDAFVATPG
jgi:predicted nucleic acid-binding protein